MIKQVQTVQLKNKETEDMVFDIPVSVTKFKRLTETAHVPTYSTDYSAGADLYADGLPEYGVTIDPGETKIIGTGLAVALPEGSFGAIYARSGWACKRGIRPANCVGVIDSDYRGEIKVALHNDSNINFDIFNGDRIAQLVCQPYVWMSFVEQKLDDTERGTGGFGSTGR